MATVSREIAINPLEPSPFSFRAPAGGEIIVEVALKKQDGTPYTADIEGSIQLQGRSDGRIAVYSMPTSDLTNGLARCSLPALEDSNGYNMLVVGTINSSLEVIAQGVLILSGRALPLSDSIDAIQNIPLYITRGQPLTLDLKLWQDEGKNYQYIGATVIANLRTNSLGDVITGLHVAPYGQPNEVRLTLSDTETAALDTSIHWWDVVLIAEGKTQTVLQGEVRFT